MFDVFTEETEVLIKEGIANLYWYRGDLQKTWLRLGIDEKTVRRLFAKKDPEGKQFTKRKLMDELYSQFRTRDFARRLETSRGFVRILIEQKSFTRQSEQHHVERAEHAALKLRELLAKQREEQEYRDLIRRRAEQARGESYDSQRSKLSLRFVETSKLEPHKRGTELEQIFAELVRISGIPVEEPFRIIGEQIDGALKYDGHYYCVEIRWREKKTDQGQIAGLYLKAEGKLDTRGIFVSMNGYSSEVIESLPKGKEVKVILLDGIHVTNVLAGNYALQELLEHAISQASLRCNIYCSHEIGR